MATVTKDFRIKSGLVVEGANATVDGSDIITEDIITGGTQTNIAVTYDAQNKVLNFVAEGGLGDGDTDDLDEGTTNLYFTDARAKAATKSLLTGTTTNLTNISISENGAGGLDITAENGVADSDTDDLDEGSTNLYFTDTRAKDAVADALGSGLQYVSGEFGIEAGNGLTFGGDWSTTELVINRNTVDTWYDAAGSAATAEENANDYTDSAIAALPPVDFTGYATETYVNTAIDNLVDGAPALLDTLNEIAAAINDDANYATTMTTALAGKQNELTAGDNISIVSDVISVTGLDADDISGFYSAAEQANQGLWDTIGSADTVQGNLDTHTTATSAHGVTGDIVGTSDYQTLTNKIIGSGGAYAEGLLFQGVNRTGQAFMDTNVFTLKNHQGTVKLDADVVSIEADSAIGINTSLGSIGIYTTGTSGNVNISSDNGKVNLTAAAGAFYGDDTDPNNEIATQGHVAGELDSYLNSEEGTEGTTILYVQDYVETAIEAGDATATPTYLAIDYNSVATQVAATTTVAGAGQVTAYAFSDAFRSAKFIVKVANGTHTEVSEVLLTLDTSDNVAITEYAVVGTNGSLSTITADYAEAASQVQLKVTTTGAGTITVMGTLLV